MAGRAATLAALLLTVAPALADESPPLGTLRQFGLLGTWAMNCAQAASPDNEYSVFAVSASGEAMLSYSRGEPYRKIVYVIRSAQRLAPDRLSLQVLHMPERAPVDLVLQREVGSIQVWSSHTLDGRMLVTNGVITGNGKASPRFQRCGP